LEIKLKKEKDMNLKFSLLLSIFKSQPHVVNCMLI